MDLLKEFLTLYSNYFISSHKFQCSGALSYLECSLGENCRLFKVAEALKRTIKAYEELANGN